MYEYSTWQVAWSCVDTKYQVFSLGQLFSWSKSLPWGKGKNLLVSILEARCGQESISLFRQAGNGQEKKAHLFSTNSSFTKYLMSGYCGLFTVCKVRDRGK